MTRAVGLTPRGRGILLSGCALLMTGFITDNPAALAAGVFTLAVCGSAIAWVSIRRRSVRISRMAPPATTTVGRDLRAIAVITVGSPGYGPALVRDLIPPGGPAADQDGGAIVRLDRPEVRVESTCMSSRRGLLEWPQVSVALPDPLGIAVGVCQAAPSGRTVVFPQSVPLGLGLARAAAGDADLDRGPSSRRGPGDPGPVPRAYRPGDEFRRMHWPATARASDPMVRDDEPHIARAAVIAIDCSAAGYRDQEGFERAVTACASISEWLLDQAWSINVQTAGGMPLADSPGLLDPQGRYRILAALAVLQQDSSGAVVPTSLASGGDAVIAIHGAHRTIPQPSVISLCTEAPDPDVSPGSLIWDGTAPLASVWAAATSQGAVL